MHNDLFQKQYDFELEQRNSIASAINIPIVAITVVASATSIISIDYQYKKENASTYAFVFFETLTLAAIVFAIFYIFRSFWNYEYKKLPNSTSLKKYHAELLNWHIKEGCIGEDVKINADASFLDYLNEQLADAGDWNGQNNIVRGNYLHLATAAIAIAAATLLPAGLIYIYNKATTDEKIHQVQIINQISQQPKEYKMTTNSQNGNNKPVAAPVAAPAPSPKPSGPPNVVFKGNSDMLKPNANNNPQKK